MATILIVDDEEADLIGMSAMLESAGHEVLGARNVDEAMELFLGRHVHLVVTDMVMPGRGGLSLISAIRDIDPGAAIIAVSGKSKGQLEASKVFGASRVMSKPIEPADLLAAVDEVIGAGDGQPT